MPKGGFKHGGGRPRGSVNSLKGDDPVRLEAKRRGMTPLEYMLDVMGDPDVDPIRRDRMAVAAAPFVHAKADVKEMTKKQEAEAAAQTIDRGTKWEKLLRRNESLDDSPAGLASSH